MRKLVAVWVLGLGWWGSRRRPCAYEDNEMPPGLEKFSRGVVNIAVGVPDEVMAHTVGMSTEYGEDTLGGFAASVMTGAFVGTLLGRGPGRQRHRRRVHVPDSVQRQRAAGRARLPHLIQTRASRVTEVEAASLLLRR